MTKLKKVLMSSMAMMIAVSPVFNVNALNNGLVKTPPMGWNSWNCFHENITEAKIKQIADLMATNGMKDAGYIYLNLDDNWMATSRDASGNLRADPTRFPSGMKALGDYIHNKGLKFGIYGDRGLRTCHHYNAGPAGTQSGSYQKEVRDATTFASWGVDYLKYDNCEPAPGSNQQKDYENMREALANCGRSIVFSVCAWGFQSWAPQTGNLWRTTGDITDKWQTSSTDWFKGIINIIDENGKLANYAAPGAWNDPDMLEVGNGGCTAEEYRTHFSMWCMMAAPLIAGVDMTNSQRFNQATKDILLNKEVIAIDQDSAGIQGTKIKTTNGTEIWSKPLGKKDGTTKAVALLNRNGNASNITVNFADVGLSGEVYVRDLWAKTDKGKFTNSFSMSVPSHGTGLLKLTTTPPVSTISTIAPKFNANIKALASNGKIDIRTEAVDNAFNVSVFLPDGKLVTRMNSIVKAATISVPNSGIYIVDMNCNGQNKRQMVSVYK